MEDQPTNVSPSTTVARQLDNGLTVGLDKVAHAGDVTLEPGRDSEFAYSAPIGA